MTLEKQELNRELENQGVILTLEKNKGDKI